MQAICHRAASARDSMTMDAIILTWGLVTVQGVRRLAESYYLVKPSTSKMWFGHWILGIGFYVALGLAVWIEGAGRSCKWADETYFDYGPSKGVDLRYTSTDHCCTETLLSDGSTLSKVTFSGPSMRTLFCFPIFLMASGIQYDCHAYLTSLPKYTLPVHPIFQSFVCPHYTMECLIYFSLTVLAAPQGAMINRTLFAVFVFVSVNLSVTASTTKEWYAEKFGVEEVAHRWKMVPSIY